MDRYENQIFDALINIASKNAIDIIYMDLKKTTPDVASPLDNVIIINRKFETRSSFSYRLAHELSHILYGEADAQAVYQFSEYGKRGEELLAHRNAIRMLMSIEMPSSPFNFMSYYHIPSWLECDVVRTFNECNIVE